MTTKIEWTEETWNPVTGCSKVSAGCTHCYAETLDRRFANTQGCEWKPWNAANAAHNVRLHPERLEAPLHWRKPRKAFVNSMSDLFHEEVAFEFIEEVFAVMALADKHTFQILTKRPKRMLEFFDKCVYNGHKRGNSPLSNVWFGVSVENQQAANERIPLLLQTPAAIRFLSCEPLLGPVDLQRVVYDDITVIDAVTGLYGFPSPHADGPKVDWVIVGGESGPGARPMHPVWARSVRDQCAGAGVPFFFKHNGEWLHESQGADPLPDVQVNGNRARSFVDGQMVKVGKKAAGRTLDGRTWDEFPTESLDGSVKYENSNDKR